MHRRETLTGLNVLFKGKGKGRERSGDGRRGRRAKGRENGIKLGVELFGRIWKESEKENGRRYDIYCTHIHKNFLIIKKIL